jgi:hypothetical protein
MMQLTLNRAQGFSFVSLFYFETSSQYVAWTVLKLVIFLSSEMTELTMLML